MRATITVLKKWPFDGPLLFVNLIEPFNDSVNFRLSQFFSHAVVFTTNLGSHLAASPLKGLTHPNTIDLLWLVPNFALTASAMS